MLNIRFHSKFWFLLCFIVIPAMLYSIYIYTVYPVMSTLPQIQKYCYKRPGMCYKKYGIIYLGLQQIKDWLMRDYFVVINFI